MADVWCGEESAIAPVLLKATELLPGFAGPRWHMWGVGNNLPQLQCSCQDLQVLGGRCAVWGIICHNSSTAESC